MFRYRKLYADLVTDEGSVCIGYASWLSLLGYELCSAGFEHYPRQGGRRVIRARGTASVERAEAALCLSFSTDAGPFSLSLQAPAQRQAAPLSLSQSLTWRVLLTNARAHVRGLGDGLELTGTGYADLVELTRPPRSLGLRSIEWGRGHVAQECFVFTRARFGDGSVFRNALRDGLASSELELSRPCGDAALEVLLADGAITLQNQRVLHRGSALDPARFPSRAERTLARLCSGRIEETRWLARATFPSGASALALHEHVLLG